MFTLLAPQLSLSWVTWSHC